MAESVISATLASMFLPFFSCAVGQHIAKSTKVVAIGNSRWQPFPNMVKTTQNDLFSRTTKMI